MKSFIINIENNKINVILNKKKIKNIYFRIDDDLNLAINLNKNITSKDINKIIKENEQAILKMYLKAKKVYDIKKEYYLYLGSRYKIVFDENKKYVELYNDYVITPSIDALNKFTTKKCREVLEERVKNIKIMFEDLPEFTLRIRKMKTRWGVCNFTKKIITLNSELITKDISLIDYVIIHELCHFKHQNHSPLFWQEVEKYYPYYKKARKMLTNI